MTHDNSEGLKHQFKRWMRPDAHSFVRLDWRLYGFRWRDRLDNSSVAPDVAGSATDQAIGTGDGATAIFALAKTYGSIYSPYQWPIVKPVAASVRVAVAGSEVAEGTAFTVDTTTGLVAFLAGHIPPVFCSTCRCASTPIISRSICPPCQLLLVLDGVNDMLWNKRSAGHDLVSRASDKAGRSNILIGFSHLSASGLFETHVHSIIL